MRVCGGIVTFTYQNKHHDSIYNYEKGLKWLNNIFNITLLHIFYNLLPYNILNIPFTRANFDSTCCEGPLSLSQKSKKKLELLVLYY